LIEIIQQTTKQQTMRTFQDLINEINSVDDFETFLEVIAYHKTISPEHTQRLTDIVLETTKKLLESGNTEIIQFIQKNIKIKIYTTV
jgi:hypothetical protein